MGYLRRGCSFVFSLLAAAIFIVVGAFLGALLHTAKGALSSSTR